MSQETNIRQLIINKLTDAQYEQAVKNADELYLTPDTGGGGGGGSGTVTSVRVQAGTGLTSSQSTAQTQVLNTTISVASGYKLPTTTEWDNKQDALATQTAYTSKGSATKVPQITTNTLGQVTGITEIDITHPTELPSQTGQSGKFLTTNGSTASWADVQDSLDLEEMILEEAIPNQSGQNGKFLTTNGITTAWATVSAGDALPEQSGNDGKFLMTNGSTPSWSEVEDALDLEELDINNIVPEQTGQSGKFLSTNGSSVFWSSTEGGGGSGYVPMPTVTTLTNTTYSLTVAENTIYEFTNAITSLTISSAVQSYLESFIYFTTGSSITFVDSSTLKWGGGSIPSLETNTTYCIAIKNGLAEIDKFGR